MGQMDTFAGRAVSRAKIEHPPHTPVNHWALRKDPRKLTTPTGRFARTIATASNQSFIVEFDLRPAFQNCALSPEHRKAIL